MKGIYWIAIVAAAFGWGAGGVFTRAAFSEGVGPWTMVVFRIAIAAVMVLVVLVARGSQVPSGSVLRYGLVQGFFNLTVPYVLFTFAYREASVGFVGLLAALIPLSTAVFANSMLGNEPLTRGKLFAFFVAFTGVAALLLSGDSGLADGGRPLLAVGLGLTSVASVGFAGTYAKKHAGAYDPTVLTGLQFGFALIWLTPAMLLIEGAPTDLSAKGWLMIVGLGVASTFLPFMLFFWLLQHVSATDASLIGYIVPFVALIGGIVFLDEQLQAGIVVGGILVFIGMVLSDRAGRHAEKMTATVPGE